MKYQEAILSLLPAQDEFASRYYRWSLVESARELAAGLPRVRRFLSHYVFKFLDFMESLSAEDARLAVMGNLKYLHAHGVARAGDALTATEADMRKQLLAFCNPNDRSLREKALLQREGGVLEWIWQAER